MGRRRAGTGAANAHDHTTYPTCVRHARPRKDVRLRHFFLCEGCTRQWIDEAFGGTQPFSYGPAIEGYCLLCNHLTNVRLQTWFLCDICDRVARSIGRNHVAEGSIMEFWQRHVVPRYPHLLLTQNDPSSLRPRRETDTSGEGPLDFLVADDRTGRTIFGIENKTGRSTIREMSRFQLDVSDCDSILHHVRQLSVPAYVIHAQVLEVWQPPTMGFRAVDLWWSDIYRMTDNFVAVQMRHTEMRGAAYFRRAAFESMDTFVDQLYDESDELRLVAQFSAQGVPRMYVAE